MYDLESRAARLLDRLRLNLDQQRMILIGSSQSIEFDAIREAAILQFPDHRPTPFVTHMREFDWNRGNGRQRREDQGAPSASTGRGAGGSNKGRGKGGKDGSGKGKSNFTPRNAYVAEQPNDLEDGSQKDDNAELEVIDENYETAGEEVDEETYAGGEQQEDDDGEIDGTEHDLDIAAHCLTVTARRLAGMKLGRKFTGGNKSLAQRKQESHCAACGERGHWKGDPECSVSGTSTSSPPASSSAKGAKSKGEKGAGKGDKKKVLTVTRPGGKQLIPTEEECPTDETYGNHFVYMVKTPTFEVASFQVFRCNLKDLSKYLVLDTACQRTCCSTKWFQHWEETVAPLRLKAKKIPNQEPFEFGHGETQYSSIHAYLPTCFNYDESAMCLLGTCVIDATNDIPLLGSNTLLVKLQAIIDLPKKEIQLQALGCAVPLLTVNNHLAVDMTCFPEQVRKSSQWNSLSQMSDSHNADPELLMNEVPPEQHRGSSVVLSNSTFPSVSNAGTTTIWIQRWRFFVMTFAVAEKMLIRNLVQAVKLGLRSRAWLSHQDPLYMQEQTALLEKYTGPCTHDQLKRYGNRHGRYSSCMNCGKKWAWNESRQQWDDYRPRKELSPLPLPSSSTAAQFQDPRYTPEKLLGMPVPPPLQWNLTSRASSAPGKTTTTSTTTAKSPTKSKLEDKQARSKLRASPPKRAADAETAMSDLSEEYEWDLVDP